MWDAIVMDLLFRRHHRLLFLSGPQWTQNPKGTKKPMVFLCIALKSKNKKNHMKKRASAELIRQKGIQEMKDVLRSDTPTPRQSPICWRGHGLCWRQWILSISRGYWSDQWNQLCCDGAGTPEHAIQHSDEGGTTEREMASKWYCQSSQRGQFSRSRDDVVCSGEWGN